MKLWEMVKAVEEDRATEGNELGEARATMIVNFGETGRCRAGLIRETDSLTRMIISVFQFYEEKLKEQEAN